MVFDKDSILRSANSVIDDARYVESLVNHKGWPVFIRFLKVVLADYVKASNRWKINKCPKCESERAAELIENSLKSTMGAGGKAQDLKEKITRGR